MQTLTEKVYLLNPPGGLFDETVVHNLFPAHSEGARKALVHRSVQYKEVLRLKPGLYCLGDVYRRSHPHPFVVAAMLHSPTHVSLESALRFHQLIPEAVYSVASVTVQRTRKFETPLGDYQFYRVPAIHPLAGVKTVEIEKDSWVFVANPLRAIADLVYLRKQVCWENDKMAFLTESMRMEVEDLAGISFAEFDDLLASFRSRRTKAYLRGLKKELGR